MQTYKHLRVYRSEEQTLHRALTDYRRLLDISTLATADKAVINEEINRAATLLNRLVLLEDVPGCSPGTEDRRFLSEDEVTEIAEHHNLYSEIHQAWLGELLDRHALFDVAVSDLRDAEDFEQLADAIARVKETNEDLWDFIDYLEELDRKDYEAAVADGLTQTKKAG